MTTCDPLTGFVMNDATATFFYGSGGLQRMQELLGTCHARGERLMQPPSLLASTKMPLLSQLILASTPTYTPYHGVVDLHQPVEVLAGGAARARPVVQLIANVEQQVQQVPAHVTSQEAIELSARLQEVTDTLNTFTWNWTTLVPEVDTNVFAVLTSADQAGMEQMHMLTTLLLQVLDKHHRRSVQENCTAPNSTYASNFSIVNKFLSKQVYRWWDALTPPKKSDTAAVKNYIPHLAKQTSKMLDKRDAVIRALVDMNRVLDDNTAWVPPRNIFVRATNFLINRARTGVLSFGYFALVQILHIVVGYTGFDQYVLDFLRHVPDTVLGGVASFLQKYVPFVHTQLEHMMRHSGTTGVDAELTHEHFKEFIKTQLILYLADYMTQAFGMPRHYIAVALAIMTVMVELAFMAAVPITRWLLNVLMNLTHLTSVVHGFDRLRWSYGILNPNSFRYKCVNGRCKVVNTYLLSRAEKRHTYKTKQECLQACVQHLN